MVTWLARPNRTSSLLARLDGLEAGVAELRAGQDAIASRLEGLQKRDGEIEDKLSHALDRFTDQLGRQYLDLQEQNKAQIELLRETLVETQFRRAWIVLRGRGLKWGERAAWLGVAALGKLVWTHVGHLRGWDALWWWPSW